MSKALVIQHIGCEGLGNIAPIMKGRGIEPEFVRLHRGERLPASPLGYAAVIVLGGPMGVYEDDVYPFIRGELRFIKAALEKEVPLLGVCLGSQLLAAAAGARVYRGGVKEIGWYGLKFTAEGMRDALVAGLPEATTVFQWHGDTFDLPKGAALLASSKAFPRQMIRVGRRAYGLQFHVEVTEAMIREWIEVNAAELSSLKGVIDPARIIEETGAHIGRLERLNSVIMSRFFDMAD